MKLQSPEGVGVVERAMVLPDELRDLHSLRARCRDGMITIQASKRALQKTAPRQVPVLAAEDAAEKVQTEEQ